VNEIEKPKIYAPDEMNDNMKDEGVIQYAAMQRIYIPHLRKALTLNVEK